MNSRVTRLAALALIGGMITGSNTGCVSGSTFEDAQRKAAYQLQNEQRIAHELAISNKQLKQRIEELETSLRTTREDLVRTERESKETRDELLKLKIDKEQQRGRGRDRFSQLERPEIPGRAEETVRRLKDLLRQLQAALDQLSGREPL
jgi:chromosome segregation ATPase